MNNDTLRVVHEMIEIQRRRRLYDRAIRDYYRRAPEDREMTLKEIIDTHLV